MQNLWYLEKHLYPETLEVLERLQAAGYRMGVISDCPPSLELSLQKCGIARYFSSFTASSLVGVGKPDPRIFQAALQALGVSAEESLYVDDCLEEADGARRCGFTAFHLDRSGSIDQPWTIHSLKPLLSYLDLATEPS